MPFLYDTHWQDSGDEADWVHVKTAAEQLCAPVSDVQPIGRYDESQASGHDVLQNTNAAAASLVPPEPPKNIRVSPGGSRLFVNNNPELTAWYERYVDWALALHPTRTVHLLSRDMALLVPEAKLSSFTQFVQRESHPVARRLKQTIGEANRRHLIDAGKGKDLVDRIVQEVARGRVMRSVANVPPRQSKNEDGKKSPEAATSNSTDKHDPRPAYGTPENEDEEDEKPDSDEEFYMQFDRRRAGLRGTGTSTPSRRQAREPITPKSLGFEAQRVSRKRPYEADSSSPSPSSPTPSPASMSGGSRQSNVHLQPHSPRTKYSRTFRNASTITKRRNSSAVGSGMGLDWQPTPSSDWTKDSTLQDNGDESDGEDGDRELEFERIRHVFRHHNVAPKPPPLNTIDNELYIVDDSWDRWFLSFIDWALEHEPNSTQYSVFAQMSQVTKLPQLAFSTMALRLRSQVTAAFSRVRGNKYRAMKVAPRFEAQEQLYVLEEVSDRGRNSSEMEIQPSAERAESKGECAADQKGGEIPTICMDDLAYEEFVPLLIRATPDFEEARPYYEESPDAAVYQANGLALDEQQPL